MNKETNLIDTGKQNFDFDINFSKKAVSGFFPF